MPNDYGVVSGNSIFQYSIPKSDDNYRVFPKYLPSDYLKGIRIHVVENRSNLKGVAPLIIKKDSRDHSTTGEGPKEIFIIDLTDEYIGNYFFLGLLVDHIQEFEKFIKDLKSGEISLGVIHMEDTHNYATVGLLVEQLALLCGNSANPVIYLFLVEDSANEMIGYMNNAMSSCFIKSTNRSNSLAIEE